MRLRTTVLAATFALCICGPARAATVAPDFTVTPAEPEAGQAVSFDAADYGFSPTYDWYFTGGAKPDATGRHASFTYSQPGTYTVRLDAADSKTGNSGSTTRTLTVTAPPPAQDVTVTAPARSGAFAISDTAPATGDKVSFDAKGQTQGGHGGVRSYRWDLDGNGTFERGGGHQPTMTTVYGEPGAFGVGLIVTYRDGTTQRGSQPLSVTGGPDACGPGHAYCHVTFPVVPSGGAGCETALRFGVADVHADCLRRDGAAYVATGQVRVNGIDLFPQLPSTHIRLDPTDGTIGSTGGTVNVTFGEIDAGRGTIDWHGLDDGASVTLPSFAANPGVAFEGFPFVGREQPTLRRPASAGAPGQATVGVYLALPEIFGNVSGAVTLHTDSDGGLGLDALHIEIASARLQNALPIKDIHFDYDGPTNTWGGGLTITKPFEVGFDAAIRVDPFGVDHIAIAVGLPDPGILVSTGIYLNQIRAQVQFDPFGLGGGITVSALGKYAGVSVAEADGDFAVVFTDPADIQLTAELRILTFKVATFAADYRTDGNFTLGAHVRVPYWEDGETPPPARIAAEMTGWIDGPHSTFDMEGSASLCLGVCVGANSVASTVGAAACVNLGFGDVGAGYVWRTRVLSGFGGFGGSCDLGPWRAVPARAVAAQAGTEQALDLPVGTHLAAFRVSGQDAPPVVTLHGPHDQSVTTPADAAGAKSAHTWVYKDPATNTTNVAISGDLAGTWTATPAPGSSAVTGFTDALGLPPLAVHARVGGRGRARTLSYQVSAAPGQKVRFAEQRGRRVGRVLGDARGTRGVLRFAPGQGPAGQRTIVALVTVRGMPRRQLVVAHYDAPRGLRPGTVRLGAIRSRTAVRVSWTKASGAARYELTLRSVNRRVQLFVLPGRRHSLILRQVLRHDRATITVRGLDAHGLPGPIRRLVLR